jgi:hypothetical protein
MICRPRHANHFPHPKGFRNAISRGDSVAILGKQIAAPKGGFFDLILIYQYLILVAGTCNHLKLLFEAAA